MILVDVPKHASLPLFSDGCCESFCQKITVSVLNLSIKAANIHCMHQDANLRRIYDKNNKQILESDGCKTPLGNLQI